MKKMNYKGIGKLIQKRRKKMGLTQAAAAEKCGLSKRQYIYAEQGDNVSITTYNKISKALDLSFSLDFPTK